MSSMTVDTYLSKQLSSLHIPTPLRHEIILLPKEKKLQIIDINHLIIVRIQSLKKPLITILQLSQFLFIFSDNFLSKRSTQQIPIPAEVRLHFLYTDRSISVEVHWLPELFELVAGAYFAIVVEIPSLP
jgi:hypothetical protein